MCVCVCGGEIKYSYHEAMDCLHTNESRNRNGIVF